MKFLPKKVVIAVILGIFFIGFFIFSFLRSSQKTKASVQATKTFTPVVIPLSAPEFLNPNRGFFRWRNQEIIPVMGYDQSGN